MKKLLKNKAGFVGVDLVIIAVVLGILTFAHLPDPAKIKRAIQIEAETTLDKIRSAENDYKLKNNVYIDATSDQVSSLLGVEVVDPQYCDAACYDVTGADSDHFTARCLVNNASVAPGAAQALRYFPGTVFTVNQAGKKAERLH